MSFRPAAVFLSLCLVGIATSSPAFGGTIVGTAQFAREATIAASATTLGHVQPSLQQVLNSPLGTFTSSTMLPKRCNARFYPGFLTNPVPCSFGDRTSSTVIVLVGSSHAGMWLQAAIDIANREKISLKAFIYTSCVPIIAAAGENAFRPTDPRVTPTSCAAWNANVGASINALNPSAVFVGSGTEIPTIGRAHSQWVKGLTSFLATIKSDRKYIIGATPHVTTDGEVAQCLLNHATNIDPCVITVNLTNSRDLTTSMLNADREVANATGATLIDVTNMFCTTPSRVTRMMKCPPVIDGRLVYVNGSHLTVNFTTHIESFLQPYFAEISNRA